MLNGHLASGSYQEIKVWNTDTGTLVRNLTGHNDDVTALAVLPNGYLAGGSWKEIKIWNTDTGGLIRTLNGHGDYVYSLVVLENGYLASGSWDQFIKIWNTGSKPTVTSTNARIASESTLSSKTTIATITTTPTTDPSICNIFVLFQVF